MTHFNAGARQRPPVRKLKRLPTLLRNSRIRMGLSQMELARKTDVACSTIERYERGLGEPSMETALRLCGLLSVDLEEIMEAVRDDVEARVKR